ncbi:MAG TPA: dethiobiotin synthase [Pirellulales bacterium]|jgi:dethiobiotin synthetase|nr:dethiobiotin synthase [Pirellulales bacterium]
MARKPVRGLFITSTDTGVGKTYAGALVAGALAAQGHRVGVYKPAASGCSRDGDMLVSDDALSLWKAAGSPETLDEVCPQRFAAPLAPHLAAIAEGKRLDPALLRRGLDVWLARSHIVLIEGAGGLMSPLGEEEYVADLAYDFGFPLLVVARNGLGAINHVLQTLIAAAAFRDGLPVAGIVLNQTEPPGADQSIEHNAREIRNRTISPLLAEIGFQASRFDPPVDWFRITADPLRRHGVAADDT